MRQADIDQLRAWMVPPQCRLIAGRGAESRDRARMDVVSAIDGRRFTTLADGGMHEIDAVVAAARAVYENGVWSHRGPAAHGKTLLAIAELIEANALELAVLGVRDNGTEIGYTDLTTAWIAL
jgi:gamma-glutamyl-gamma-aminobutyraldehyde dehydrogenase